MHHNFNSGSFGAFVIDKYAPYKKDQSGKDHDIFQVYTIYCPKSALTIICFNFIYCIIIIILLFVV